VWCAEGEANPPILRSNGAVQQSRASFVLSTARRPPLDLKGETMKRVTFLLVGMLAVAGVVASSGPASGKTDEQASPIYGIAIPPGYRD